MSAVKLAIVGTGGIARVHIAAAHASNGRIAVNAVVDPDERARHAAADAAGGEAKAFGSFEQFMSSAEAKDARGVIVCTPPSVRIAIVREALAAGMGVLSEKPIAHNAPDAKMLAQLAAKSPRSVSIIGYCHRFAPAIAEMKKRIAAGEIGQITRFENTFAAPMFRLKDHWMSDPKVSGGGALIDTGSHSLDLFNHLVGRGDVTSAAFYHGWPGRGETSATLTLRANEAAGVVQSGWLEPGRFVVSVVGIKGSFHYDYDHPTELRFRSNDGPEKTIAVPTHEERFGRQLMAFADAISGNGSSANAPFATFADGLHVAEQVEHAQRLAT